MGADSFAQLVRVAELMATFQRPWFIAGGWAIDLFAGRITREHKDADVGLFREDQLALQAHSRGWDLRKVPQPMLDTPEPWRQGEWLALPVHEIHARREGCDPTEVEFLLNEQQGEDWCYRRNLSVRLPLTRAILHTRERIPYLCPEAALLYKSRHFYLESPRFERAKADDEHDLRVALPLLDGEQRAWLRQAIANAYPMHPWLGYLATMTEQS